MEEASKAARRRKNDWRFTNRWFVGRGIDIGCGPDPLKKEDWPLITEVVPYDKELSSSADGQYLPDIKDGEFDFIHSSHCLEHLHNTRSSLTNWLRILKPGGFIICTIPEELLYEYGRWPSRWNPDHKVSFTMRAMPIIPGSINVPAMLWKHPVDVEHITLLTEGWDKTKAGQDQTLGDAECAIEFVVRKQVPPGVMPF
jgi:predicted SAM-dependent methyltransferase